MTTRCCFLMNGEQYHSIMALVKDENGKSVLVYGLLRAESRVRDQRKTSLVSSIKRNRYLWIKTPTVKSVRPWGKKESPMVWHQTVNWERNIKMKIIKMEIFSTRDLWKPQFFSLDLRWAASGKPKNAGKLVMVTTTTKLKTIIMCRIQTMNIQQVWWQFFPPRRSSDLNIYRS